MKPHFIRDFIRESFLPPRPVCERAVGSPDKPRIIFIDLAKGLCILLVLFYHFDSKLFGLPNFNALRMPLYFTLSGLFFKSYENIVQFSLKKINNILVPFFFWMLFAYLLKLEYRWAVFHQIEPLKNFWLGFGTRNLYLNYPLWFLVCLFITNILFYLLNRFLEGPALAAGVLALALAGCAADARGIYLPLWFDSACTAMPFFYMGYMLKKSPLLHQSTSRPGALLAGICCIGAAYLLYWLFDRPTCGFRTNVIEGDRLILYLDSLLFVLGVLLVCKTVQWLPVVSYFGRYSLVVLCVQALFLRYVPLLCKLNGITLPLWERRMLILLLCWLSIPLCKTLLPWFTAQKPLLKYPRRLFRQPAPGAATCTADDGAASDCSRLQPPLRPASAAPKQRK